MKLMKQMIPSAMLALGLLAVPALSGCGGEIEPGAEIGETQAAVLSADFDLKTKGIFGGSPFLTVAGKAGNTKPASTSNDAYAYVFYTDQGTFIFESHKKKDHPLQFGEGDFRYHAHKITLNASNCIVTQANDGVAQANGNKVTLVWALFNNFPKAQTVRFSPSGTTRCISEVFDTLQ